MGADLPVRLEPYGEGGGFPELTRVPFTRVAVYGASAARASSSAAVSTSTSSSEASGTRATSSDSSAALSDPSAARQRSRAGSALNRKALAGLEVARVPLDPRLAADADTLAELRALQ